MYFFRNVILSLTITLWLKGSFQEIDGGTGSVLSRPNGHLRPFHTFSLLHQPSLLSYLWGDSTTVLSALLFSCALAWRHAQALPSHTLLPCTGGRLKKKHNFIFYFKTVFSRRFLNLSDEVRGNLVRFVFEWRSSFMTSRVFLHDRKWFCGLWELFQGQPFLEPTVTSQVGRVNPFLRSYTNTKECPLSAYRPTTRLKECSCDQHNFIGHKLTEFFP